MVFGFILSFFFDHRIVWVALRVGKEGDQGKITVAGRAVRHPLSFDTRFDKILNTLKKELSPFVLNQSQ